MDGKFDGCDVERGCGSDGPPAAPLALAEMLASIPAHQHVANLVRDPDTGEWELVDQVELEAKIESATVSALGPLNFLDTLRKLTDLIREANTLRDPLASKENFRAALNLALKLGATFGLPATLTDKINAALADELLFAVFFAIAQYVAGRLKDQVPGKVGTLATGQVDVMHVTLADGETLQVFATVWAEWLEIAKWIIEVFKVLLSLRGGVSAPAVVYEPSVN